MVRYLVLGLLLAGCVEDGRGLPNVESACGDGVLDRGESCDDGAANSDTTSDACRTDCRPARCGDGVVDQGESCDDGRNDGRYGTCTPGCALAPRCGDGVVQAPESCDDGPLNSATEPGACRPSCVRPACSDGVVDPGEICLGRTALPLEDAGYPYEILSISDRDADGLDEVLVRGSSEIALLASRNGVFETAWSRPRGTGLAWSGDVNRDGIEDVGLLYSSSVAWWLGRPDGMIEDEIAADLGTSLSPGEVSPEVADLGGDGINELFSTVVVDGDTRFQVRVLGDDGAVELVGDVDLPDDEAWYSRARDMDGDGDLDALIRCSTLPLAVFSRVTSNIVEEPIPVPALRFGPVYDAEVDGRPPLELVVPRSNSDSIEIYGVGEGGPELESTISLDGRRPWLSFADLDGNGIDELMDVDGGLLRIRGLPSGEVQREHDYPIELDGAGLLFDTDLDGERELVAYSGWEAYVGRPAAGPLERVTFELGGRPGQLRADADEAPDYVSAPGGFFAVALGRDYDALQSYVLPRFDSGGVVDVVIVEPTLIAGRTEGGRLVLQRLAEDASPEILFEDVTALAAAPFDGNASRDLAVASGSTVGIALRRAGGFDALVGTATVPGTVEELVEGDVSGDEVLDVVYRTDSEEVGVLRGDGRGGLSLASSVSISDAASIVVADLDEDDLDDVIVRSSGAVQILRSSPQGLVPQTAISVPEVGPMAVGDVDGDGVLDLVVVGEDRLWLLEGDGLGDFGRPSRVEAAPWPALRPVVGDLDADGVDEVVVLSELRFPTGPGRIATILDGSSGALQRGGSFVLRRSPLDAELGDANGDSLLDLVVAASDLFSSKSELTVYLAHP